MEKGFHGEILPNSPVLGISLNRRSVMIEGVSTKNYAISVPAHGQVLSTHYCS